MPRRWGDSLGRGELHLLEGVQNSLLLRGVILGAILNMMLESIESRRLHVHLADGADELPGIAQVIDKDFGNVGLDRRHDMRRRESRLFFIS